MINDLIKIYLGKYNQKFLIYFFLFFNIFKCINTFIHIFQKSIPKFLLIKLFHYAFISAQLILNLLLQIIMSNQNITNIQLLCKLLIPQLNLQNLNIFQPITSNLTPNFNQQINNSINNLVQTQLIQKLLQEKIKNQLLINTIQMITQKKPESQIQSKQQTINKIKQPEIFLRKTEQKQEHVIPQTIQKQQKKSIDYEYSESDQSFTSGSQIYKKSIKRTRNQTKNIPKNYGKAILTYIQKNQKQVKRVLANFPDIQYDNYVAYILERRKYLNSIADVRNLWLQQTNKYAGPTRILSNIFLKKHSLKYIFNSRVANLQGHIKYRHRLIEGLKNPSKFTCIKIS